MTGREEEQPEQGNQQSAAQDEAKQVIFQFKSGERRQNFNFSPRPEHNPLKAVKSNAGSILTALVIKPGEKLNLVSSMSTNSDFSLQDTEVKA